MKWLQKYVYIYVSMHCTSSNLESGFCSSIEKITLCERLSLQKILLICSNADSEHILLSLESWIFKDCIQYK